MRRKKSKLDKIRHEKAQSELAEATFKPALNPRRPPSAATAGAQQHDDGEVAGGRGVGQLLQYVRGVSWRAPMVWMAPTPPYTHTRSGTSTSARPSASSSSWRSRTAS